MKKLYKSTLILIVIMFVSKLVAFGRDIVLTNCYGASYISDAFLIAISIPTVLFSGVVTALFTCYIPFYKELKEKRPDEIEVFNGNLLIIVFILSCCMLVFCWTFEDAVLKLFAIGFDEITFQLAKKMFHIMAVVMPFMGIAYILQGFLQANENFYLVGAMTIPTNVIIALSIWNSTEITLQSMAWGVLLGYVIYIPYFGIPAYKRGFRVRPCLDTHDENLKTLLTMVIPVFIGQIIFEINSVVDKSVASLLPMGGITALDYSFKVVSMIHSSIVAPISTIVYPRFSKYAVSGEDKILKDTLNLVLRIVEIIIIPAVGGIIVVARPIIEILFFRGAFTDSAVKLTVECLVAYAFCVIPISLRIICEKVFYAKKETKIPMLNSIGGIIVNIILDLVLVGSFAHVGLALATTVSSIVTFVLFLISLRQKIGEFGGKKIIVTGMKAGISTVIMCLILVYLNQKLIIQENTLQVFINIIVGTVIYIFVMLALREKMLINYLIARRRT